MKVKTKRDNVHEGLPLPVKEGQGGSLPSDFMALMRSHLGADQAEALFRGLQEPPTVAVRFNSQKLAALAAQGLSLSPELCDPVTWCPDAYYLADRPGFTFDPLFHAGAYYVQDASSMYLAEVLRRYLPGDAPLTALDLCAAPGGKSTLLAGSLPAGSLLISNEPIRKRAQVLAENMEKWCGPFAEDGTSRYPIRSVVTQNYPGEFGRFRDTFDFLLTDVPCSGEGMFRKEEQAVREWSLQNVRQCAERQRDILRSILPTLKLGGLLVYSTCTFNRFEDEEQVAWLMDAFRLQLLEERHFFPGRDRGEGLYMAALRKPLPADAAEVVEHTVLPGSPQPSSRPGKSMTFLKALNVLPIQNPIPTDAPVVALSYAQAIAYLRHEALHLAAPRGLVAVAYRGLLLGTAKSVGTRLNNLYPSEWRIRTTYSPSDPISGFLQ